MGDYFAGAGVVWIDIAMRSRDSADVVVVDEETVWWERASC